MADGEATAQTTKQKNKGAWKRKSFTRRQHEARAWLERLVPPERITDARVNQLADFVDRYRPGTKFQIIADAMVKNNEVPTMKNVAARYESRKNAYLRRNAPTSPIDLTPALVEHLTTPDPRILGASGPRTHLGRDPRRHGMGPRPNQACPHPTPHSRTHRLH
ncbi:hypothetical protein [Paenarthrobacter ureafaciens]|uniref:hypothetical protein n=1 Tax=Paenarthrobacter ureafaciens TaxID=37931 RepID=UPI001C2BCAD8|nr:hypothetical protein [Paenarthrobacter ureafaciens]